MWFVFIRIIFWGYFFIFITPALLIRRNTYCNKWYIENIGCCLFLRLRLKLIFANAYNYLKHTVFTEPGGKTKLDWDCQCGQWNSTELVQMCMLNRVISVCSVNAHWPRCSGMIQPRPWRQLFNIIMIKCANLAVNLILSKYSVLSKHCFFLLTAITKRTTVNCSHWTGCMKASQLSICWNTEFFGFFTRCVVSSQIFEFRTTPVTFPFVQIKFSWRKNKSQLLITCGLDDMCYHFLVVAIKAVFFLNIISVDE